MHLTGISVQLPKKKKTQTETNTGAHTQPACTIVPVHVSADKNKGERASLPGMNNYKKTKEPCFFFPPVSPSFVCLVNPSVVYSEFSTNKMEDHSLHGAHTTCFQSDPVQVSLSNVKRLVVKAELLKLLSIPLMGFDSLSWICLFPSKTSGLFLHHCSGWQTQTIRLQCCRTETLFCLACGRKKGQKEMCPKSIPRSKTIFVKLRLPLVEQGVIQCYYHLCIDCELIQLSSKDISIQ